ncbi:MAG: type 4 pilus major pilin [Candidatus Eutrophobiaceae bacterium]
MSHQKRKTQHGVTLIEAIIFLAIFAVVVGAALSKAGIAFSSNRSAQSVDAVLLITSGIKSTYQMRPSYQGLTTEVAINNGLVPEHMVNGKKITHTWGGDLDVEATTAPKVGFNIIFKQVPGSDCMRFVNATSTSFEQVNVGSATVKATTDKGSADPQKVGAECTKGGGSKDITLFTS